MCTPGSMHEIMSTGGVGERCLQRHWPAARRPFCRNSWHMVFREKGKHRTPERPTPQTRVPKTIDTTTTITVQEFHRPSWVTALMKMSSAHFAPACLGIGFQVAEFPCKRHAHRRASRACTRTPHACCWGGWAHSAATWVGSSSLAFGFCFALEKAPARPFRSDISSPSERLIPPACGTLERMSGLTTLHSISTQTWMCWRADQSAPALDGG